MHHPLLQVPLASQELVVGAQLARLQLVDARLDGPVLALDLLLDLYIYVCTCNANLNILEVGGSSFDHKIKLESNGSTCSCQLARPIYKHKSSRKMFKSTNVYPFTTEEREYSKHTLKQSKPVLSLPPSACAA